jgi:hypothetical protein
VRDIAIFLDEYPDIGGELLSHFNNDIKQAQRAAVEQYQGCYDSLADYAQVITEDSTSIPSHLNYYIDYERMARDMEMNGDFFVIVYSQKTHVFWSINYSLTSFIRTGEVYKCHRELHSDNTNYPFRLS